jgi:LPPG:FO 2-phospho-L-lactate transferase
MKVVVLAGGVGAGKFLRGLVRVIPAEEISVVVNTGDDLELHGLHISPDIDSVTYWLAGLADRQRGWGRKAESFRALEEVRRLGGQAWFSLGDLDLATHLVRTQWLHEGVSLSEVTDRIRHAHGVEARIIPMSDQPVRTWIDGLSPDGEAVSHPFQVYWVGRGARDEVKAIRFAGAAKAAPAPRALEAMADADILLVSPSNPVVSIAPILAVPGMAESIRNRAGPAAGVSPIVAGAPVAGMADRLMPAAGLEVSAVGAASAYRGLVRGFVIDERDAPLAPRIEAELGMVVALTDTLMFDDDDAERVARAALEAAG